MFASIKAIYNEVFYELYYIRGYNIIHNILYFTNNVALD